VLSCVSFSGGFDSASVVSPCERGEAVTGMPNPATLSIIVQGVSGSCGLGIGAIVGIVVGTVACGVGGTLLVCFLMRRKRAGSTAARMAARREMELENVSRVMGEQKRAAEADAQRLSNLSSRCVDL